MVAEEYAKILVALDIATRTVCSNQGDLNAADMRIRSLVSIAARETRRALRDAGGASPAGTSGDPQPDREASGLRAPES